MRWRWLISLGLVVVAAACNGGVDDIEDTIPTPEDAGPDREPDRRESGADSLPPDGGGPCEATCSEDLHSVLSCTGLVKERCSDDTACLNAACLDPCEAAQSAHGTAGCEYVVPPPAQLPEDSGRCFVVALANTWTSASAIAVAYEGVTLDVSALARIPKKNGTTITYETLDGGKLPAGQVALLFLAARGGAGCPAGTSPAITDRDIQKSDTGVLSAFRIETSRPVAGFDFYPYGAGAAGMAAASMLLPTSAWRNEYLAQTPYDGAGAERFVQIAASADKTQVEIWPTRPVSGAPDAGIPPVDAGVTVQYTLDKGKVLQLVQGEELAGSVVVSDKPVGVWGGATRLAIPGNLPPDDFTHRQVYPIRILGNEYAAVRHPDRIAYTNENTVWRVVGVADNTSLAYAPKKPKGAPSQINKGEVATFSFEGSEEEPQFPFVIRSQDMNHPFYFWSYMTSGANANGLGGAEWTDVVPTAQYRSSYLFFTDPSFDQTSLTVVRTRQGNGSLSDVTLDCHGALSEWTPLDAEDRFEYTRFRLSAFAECGAGVHTITSDSPFGLTVWGWGPGASYSFPAGIAARWPSIFVP